MRFKQFLLEDPTYSLEEGLKKIKNECKPFLSQSNGKPMFRGIPRMVMTRDGFKENDMEGVRFFDHPENRKPRDSDEYFNVVFNTMCNEAFELPMIRTYSIFATGSLNSADGYGTVNFMFPRGDIEFIWSSKIEDSYENENESKIIEALVKNINARMPTELKIRQADLRTIIGETIENTSAKDFLNSTDKAAKTFNTRFIGNYSKISRENPFLKTFNPFAVLMDSFVKTGQDLYKQGNLFKALDSKNEILFYKSSGYYLISMSSIVEHAQKANAISGHYPSSAIVYSYLLNHL